MKMWESGHIWRECRWAAGRLSREAGAEEYDRIRADYNGYNVDDNDETVAKAVVRNHLRLVERLQV